MFCHQGVILNPRVCLILKTETRIRGSLQNVIRSSDNLILFFFFFQIIFQKFLKQEESVPFGREATVVCLGLTLRVR